MSRAIHVMCDNPDCQAGVQPSPSNNVIVPGRKVAIIHGADRRPDGWLLLKDSTGAKTSTDYEVCSFDCATAMMKSKLRSIHVISFQ